MEKKVSLLVFLLAFSENLDSQIPGNKKHSSRVGYTSLNIANALGLSEERKYSLLISSLLHDAGDGKIVSEKDMTIPEHALKGNIFIEDVPFLEKPAAIIKYHHIPWDFGKGSIYEEEEIPIESHILHLAEFIDNYIDKDKYILKEKSKVIKKIKEEKDAIFNPDVVDTFLDLSSKEAFWFEINYDTIDPSSFKNDLQLDLDELLLLSKAIARIVDFRSKIQVRHSKNVAAISYFIGENLKLPKEKIEELRIAGYLHDIGKVAIPPQILTKESKLTKKECEYIKVHPYKTYLTLKKSIPFGDIVLWASLHHEKLNGKGYPFHLTKDEIPFEARIISIADIFAALLEDRPYRKGTSVKRAVANMKGLAKNGYIDSDILGILIENLEEISNLIKL